MDGQVSYIEAISASEAAVTKAPNQQNKKP